MLNEMNTSVAGTILTQLGGNSRVAAMTGAARFLTGRSSLSFQFKGSKKANYVEIKLDREEDTYTVIFTKTGGHKYARTFETVQKTEGVYAQDLVRLFEESTGLFLSL